MKIVLPEIETSRLLLRQFTPEHLNDLFLVRLDPDVMKFITGVPPTRELGEAGLTKHLHCWKIPGFGHWAVRFKKNPRLLRGCCGRDFLDSASEIEVGYGLARNYWGVGVRDRSGRSEPQMRAQIVLGVCPESRP